MKSTGLNDLDTRIKLVGYASKILFLAAVGLIVFLLTSRTTLGYSVDNEPQEWNSTVQTGPPSPGLNF